MPSPLREAFDAGRQRVRAALDGRAPPPRSRSASREEPFLNAVLYAGTAPSRDETAAMAAEIENLRALLRELSEVAEASVARNGELETMLAETQRRAERFAEVLELPGVRKALLSFHPDRHPEADDDRRRALTEAISKINAAYDLIDRTRNSQA